ncbi:ST3 beta-galactoside alpha-2,3-sialyltransferase 7 isoform 1-T2 [Pholidichthys leucotaenia]
MVTWNHLRVESPDDGSLLLPKAGEYSTQTRVPFKPKAVTKTDSRDVFISRKQNFAISLLLLIGCYSAILIPAYFPLDKLKAPNDDYKYPKDLDLFNRSVSLLSDPCRPHWCVKHLKSLSCSPGLLDIPVFVQEERPEPWDMPLPLGFQGSEEHLAMTLAYLPQPGLPPSLKREGSCRRCVVVGSGGVLSGSHLGAHIDQYDVIIRLNDAPVQGYERDAGSRTTFRLFYPEGAPHSANEYTKTAMVILVAFKSLDLDWLASIITKQPLSFWSKLWFWKKVVDDIPLKPESFKILHPEIIHKTGQVLQKYSLKRGNVPTLGASAVVTAFQLCDQVSLAGFGYDMQQPHDKLHYYGSNLMDSMKAQVVHDVSAEKLFLRELVASRAVTDLTGAL